MGTLRISFLLVHQRQSAEESETVEVGKGGGEGGGSLALNLNFLQPAVATVFHAIKLPYHVPSAAPRGRH